MKKWVFVVAGALVVAGVLIDVFIPSTLTVSRVELLRCRAAAAWPFLSEEARWGAWWRDSGTRKDFHVQGLSYYVVHIDIRDRQGEVYSRLSLLPEANQDSALLQWEASISCGWSPLDRLVQYRRAQRLVRAMDGVLGSAGDYLSKKENLYGTKIVEVSTVDTLLISTRTEQDRVPTNEDIYAKIAQLRRHIGEVHIEQTGFPMVNISRVEDSAGSYRLMVAIPVGARTEGRGDFIFTRLVPGRFLFTEVRGGPAAVERAMSGIKDYIRDYQRTVMAVPFQSFVTDRMKERDSTRWITRIYYPVM